MAMTVSMSVGRVAIMHDIRREISANVDTSLSHQNETFIDKLAPYNYDVEAYTNATFQPYIDEYNSRQTRENRKKDKSYVEYIKAENDKLIRKADDNKKKGIKVSTRKPTKLCHEYVLQFGNRDDNGISSGADITWNREAARKTLEDIQKKYPHAEILLATFHADEPNGTPHMHILVQFVGEGYEKGLSRQISMSKALENDGFERSQNRGDYAINKWTKDIQDTIMTENLRVYFAKEREILNEKRGHDDIRIFREKAKREVEAVAEAKKEAAVQLSFALDATRKLSDPERTEPVPLKMPDGKMISFTPVPELQRQSAALNDEIRDLTQRRDETTLEVKKVENELSEAQKMGKYLADREGREGIRVYDAEIPNGAFRKKSIVAVESELDAAQVRSVFKANAIREGVLVEAENKLAKADSIIQESKNVIQERDSILARAKKKAEEILKEARDFAQKIKDEIAGLFQKREALEKECNGLTNKKEELVQELDTLQGRKAELEPLKQELDDLQRTCDILSGKAKNEYTKAFFRDWNTMPFGSSYDSYRKEGKLLALYNDGSIRKVGTNENGGWDYKTLNDVDKGLCKVGLMENERSVKVPESLFRELIKARDREKPVSQNLEKLIQQEAHVAKNVSRDIGHDISR